MRVDLEFFDSLFDVLLESEKVHVNFNDKCNADIETVIDGG